MSFLVCHMEKFGKHDLKGLQFHNQRERESKTNPDIDYSKSNLNYDIHNSINIDFNKSVNDKINQLELKKKVRKDAVVINEFIVTSDKGFFDKLSPEEQKRFFEEAYKFLGNRYGEKNVVHANVHIDEKTPHLHIGIVPITKGKLCSKELFNKTELINLQTDFAKYMHEKKFDIDRGEGTSGKHIETKELKIKTLNKEIAQAEGRLKDIKDIQLDTSELDNINSKVVSAGLTGMFKKQVSLSQEEYHKLYDKAREGVINKHAVSKLEYENRQMQQKLSKSDNEVREAHQETYNVRSAYNDLKKELEEYKTTLKGYESFLKENGIFETARKFIETLFNKKDREKDNERE